MSQPDGSSNAEPRGFAIFDDGDIDVAAEIAKRVRETGLRPEDGFAFRWLREGEAAPTPSWEASDKGARK